MTNEHETPEQIAARMVKEFQRKQCMGCRFCDLCSIVLVQQVTAVVKHEREHTQAEIERLTKERHELIEWTNRGGAPTGRLCRHDPNDVHEIYGPFVSDDAHGNNPVCQTHTLQRSRNRALELEQANKELLEALQSWIDDFAGRPIANWIAADGERVQEILNAARAALAKHDKGAKG